MHDIVDLEARGVVSAFVASTEFVDAASTQAKALGFEAVARGFVPHPIQDRTAAGMRALADAAFAEIVSAVTATEG